MATVTLYPNAAGDLTEATPVGEATNWECVDEVVADDDTSYVRVTVSATKRDLYNLPALPSAVGAITNVTVYARVRRTQAATSSAGTHIKTNGSSYDGGGITFNDQAWYNQSQSYDTNPQSGNAWTIDEVNALQAGCRLGGNNYLNNQVRCTQVYVVVTYTPALARSQAHIIN